MDFRVMAGKTDKDYYVELPIHKAEDGTLEHIIFHVEETDEDATYNIEVLAGDETERMLNKVSPKNDLINSKTVSDEHRKAIEALIISAYRIGEIVTGDLARK